MSVLPATLGTILDLTRWAPSGDNTQPWRFEVVDEHRVVVHGFDTRSHCVYDLDGRPSQISIGAMLETMRIAATGSGLRTEFDRRLDADDAHPTFDVRFVADASLQRDPLIDSIERRSVQRRPLSGRALTALEKQSLQACLPAGHDVLWLEGGRARLRTARLLFRCAKLRLTMPEAYAVHRDIIDWGSRFSADRVPDQALGVDPLTAKLMHFVMRRWERVQFFNRFLAGTWAPRIQMDVIPGIACAAHFVILAPREPAGIDDYIDAGGAAQRFWLTATHLGLQLQPEMTPLIFTRYARQGVSFSTTPGLHEAARDLSRRLEALVGEDAVHRGVFMGRIGAGPAARSRSLRRPLSELLVERGGTPKASPRAHAARVET